MDELFLGLKRVVHHRHGADPQDRIIGDDELGHVGQEQTHLVARLHPDRRQGFGETVHQRLQLPVCDLLPHEDERRNIRKPLGGPRQDLGHRDLLKIRFPSVRRERNSCANSAQHSSGSSIIASPDH